MMPVSNTEEEGTFANRLKEKCIEIEKRPGVLNCSVMHGFPYQDSDFCGVYPMVTTENNLKQAQELVDELAQWIWDHRKESIIPLEPLDKTMSTVLAMLEKDGHYVRKLPTKGDVIDHTPIVIGDAADNPGGGAGGGGTHLLKALMETKGLGKVAFMSIHDPETAGYGWSNGTSDEPNRFKVWVANVAATRRSHLGPEFSLFLADAAAKVERQSLHRVSGRRS